MINRVFIITALLFTNIVLAEAQVIHPAFNQRKANTREFTLIKDGLVKHYPFEFPSGKLDSAFRILDDQPWSEFGLYPFCFELNKKLHSCGIQGLIIQPDDGVNHARKFIKINITFIEDKPIVTESGEEKLPLGSYLLSLNRKPIKDWVDIAIQRKYGEVYPHGSFTELTESFSNWIGEVSPTDTFSIIYMDFFDKKVHQVVLSGHYFEGYQKWKTTSLKPGKPSSTALEELDQSELVYANATEGMERCREILCRQGVEKGILDLRNIDTLEIQDAVRWATSLIGSKVNFSIIKNLKTPDLTLGERLENGTCTTKITLLINGGTGVAATLLSAAVHDRLPSQLAGSETKGTYQGGFLPQYHWIRIFEGKIKVGIPQYYLKYDGDQYPLKDRGIIPEHLFQGTWEDYMQGEDAELSALIRQLTADQ